MAIGIGETREVISALGVLARAIRRAVGNGLDVTDIFALVGDAEVRDALAAAATGITEVPAEAMNLDLREIGTLVQDLLGVIEDIRTDASTPAT